MLSHLVLRVVIGTIRERAVIIRKFLKFRKINNDMAFYDFIFLPFQSKIPDTINFKIIVNLFSI